MRILALLSLGFCLLVAGAAAAQNRGLGPAGGPIAELQRELRRQGYDAGPANGILTAQTQRAIGAYRHGAGPRPAPLTVAAERLDGLVARVQRALAAQGLLRGPADGVVGPRTRDAIIRFEIARHLRVDPRISDRLLAALGGSDAAAAAMPRRPNPADAGRLPLPPGVTPPPIR